MASFVKLPSGSWRAIVRRRRRYISETFRRKDDVRAWALNAERQIDRSEAPKGSRSAKLKTFGDLVDLRHEGTSRLFEAGFAIEQVALVTGHKDWKMLRRYTHLKRESLYAIAASRAA